MATLPDTNFGLSGGLQTQEQPSLTWYVNTDTGRIQGTTDGLAAVKQAIEIILNVDRFDWQIYSPYFGMQWSGLLGQNPGYVASEIQRRIKDAFSTDSRILGIENFTYSISGDTMTADFTVSTVYGQINQNVEVTLS